jgi:hypothetical protein
MKRWIRPLGEAAPDLHLAGTGKYPIIYPPRAGLTPKSEEGALIVPHDGPRVPAIHRSVGCRTCRWTRLPAANFESPPKLMRTVFAASP